MKPFARNSMCVLLLLVLALLLLPGRAAADTAFEAEETVFLDCGGDQRSYGEQVAELKLRRLNVRGDEIQSPAYGEKTLPLTAVLVRSNGQAVDFSDWAPRYVVAGPYNCYTLFFANAAEAGIAARELAARDTIRYAEPDGSVRACGAEDYSFRSWGATAMNFGAYLDYQTQWRSGEATVAIIDSGVYLHPMLKAWIRESGHDYIDNDDDSTNDLYGHGTNVAGVVADCTAGAPVYLYPIRVLNAGGGGSISNVVNAVREATEKGVTVMNLSLESRNLSQALDDAIADALDAGITVVIAAGNSNVDTAQICPAHLRLSGAIVVGSAESDGSKSSYSNFGASVDVYAYGSAISCCSRTGGYTTATGTSIAAPHITALSALLRLLHPELSPAGIESRILWSSQPDATVNIPDLNAMIPLSRSFSLQTLRLEIGESVAMPLLAAPMTAQEQIHYSSSDESVLCMQNGRMTALGTGTATIEVSCTGFPDISFEVIVEEESGAVLLIPAGALVIGDEAFRGNGAIGSAVIPEGTTELGAFLFEECPNLRTVRIPASVVLLGENSFSGAVILCTADTQAEDFARENQLSYISVSD